MGGALPCRQGAPLCHSPRHSLRRPVRRCLRGPVRNSPGYRCLHRPPPLQLRRPEGQGRAAPPPARQGSYERDKRIPPPATNSKPAQPITEGRSPRKAKPINATINRLNLSTGTTKEASPCFRALKKQNDDKPLARPESTMNSQVCWDKANGLVNFPVTRMSNGRKIAITKVRIRVARSASMLSSPILPSTADALAKSADKKAQINHSGRAWIGLI